jgi:hypothetical protein
MKYDIEYTDTFSGEANYSWVRRATIDVPDDASDLTLMRRAKAAIDLTGIRGTRVDFGDTISFVPYCSNTIMFITPADEA